MKTRLVIMLTLLSGIANAQILQWAKAMGGTNNDYALSITTDAAGNVYTTGFFNGTADFDPGIGTFTLASVGFDDIFISKLDASGNFVWAKAMNGAASEVGRSIVVDASGNVFTTGTFQSTVDFDPSAGTYTLTPAGGDDIFISKLDPSGNFVWAKAIGSTNGDSGYSIALDHSGNVFITGGFSGTVDFDPGAGTYTLTPSPAGFFDIFISKLDASGNFVYAKAMGGTGGDVSHSICIDTFGNIYTTGNFQSTADFDPGTGIFNLTATGTYDIFISKLDASGNFVWAKAMDGTSYNFSNSISTDASGNVYTTGVFNGITDFDPSTGIFNLTATSTVPDGDIFISKLDASGNFVWAKALGGIGEDIGYSIAIDTKSNVYTTGHFNATIDFDPGLGTFNLTSAGYDIFVSVLDSTGNFVWAGSIVGTGYDGGYSIATDISGNVYATGQFQSTADFDPGIGVFNLMGEGSGDIFVLKISQPSLSIKELSEEVEYSIYPNPFSLQTTLQVNKIFNDATLTIYNLYGQELKQIKNISGQTITLNREHLPNGLYFIRLMQKNQIFTTGKIIITDN